MPMNGGSGFDLRPWSDAHYPATIEKYKLRDIQEAKHLCPKLYYEPRGSSEEEVGTTNAHLDFAARCSLLAPRRRHRSSALLYPSGSP